MKLLLSFMWSGMLPVCLAFEWTAGGGKRPDITYHEIAGLWKLAKLAPLKEFTVRPRSPTPPDAEVLLMLKEDGTFQQYKNDLAEVDEDVNEAWKRFQQLSNVAAASQPKKPFQESFAKGTWSFVNGKLLLAADRPAQSASAANKITGKTLGLATPEQQDTLLVGRVVATSGTTSLGENHVLGNDSAARYAANDAALVQVDTRLSVPLGTVKVGKFFYPRNHPSFFEQPMFQPRKHDVVCLRQVLGSLNARQNAEDDAIVEKYRCSDFYDKTFLLSSHPLRHNFKGKKRWSIKYNEYVYDKSDAVKKEEEAEAQRMANIRVMQVRFFANNTFSTVAGLGDDVILRGKYDVIGRGRDQLWMQVWRFGFGRSVSGSVYSEGRSLTQEDAKTYWGSIAREGNGTTFDIAAQLKESEPGSSEGESQRIEVKGSVMLGWGLEPQPVARFIMREAREADITLADDEDDDDDSDDDNVDYMGRLETLEPGVGEDGIYLSGDEAFQ